MASDENITSQIPEANKTSLGLYVTPKEAYAMWKADPEGIHALDVRTFEEYTLRRSSRNGKDVPLSFPSTIPMVLPCPAGLLAATGRSILILYPL